MLFWAPLRFSYDPRSKSKVSGIFWSLDKAQVPFATSQVISLIRASEKVSRPVLEGGLVLYWAT